MKRFNRWMLMLVVALTSVSLAACDNSDDDNTPGNGGETEPPVENSIAAAIASADGTTVQIDRSTVVASNAAGVLLYDESGYIQVYTAEDSGLIVGNAISVNGTVQTKNGLKSIATGATIDIVDIDTTTYKQPEPKALTDEMIMGDAKIEYVKYTGTIQKASNGDVYLFDENTKATRSVRLLLPESYVATVASNEVWTLEGYTVGVALVEMTGGDGKTYTFEMVDVMVTTGSKGGNDNLGYRAWLLDENSNMDPMQAGTDQANLKFTAKGGTKKIYIFVDGTTEVPEISCDKSVVEIELEKDDNGNPAYVANDYYAGYMHYTAFVTLSANESTDPMEATITVKVGKSVHICPVEQEGKIEGTEKTIWFEAYLGNETTLLEEGKAYDWGTIDGEDESITFTFSIPSAANNNPKKTTRWNFGAAGCLVLWPGDAVTISSKSGNATFKKIEIFTLTTNDVSVDKGEIENGVETSFWYGTQQFILAPLVWTGSEKSVTFTSLESQYSWVAVRAIYTE